MQRYKNGEASGVQFFKTGKNFIELVFEDGGHYIYDNNNPGKEHIENMKSLAVKGNGLNTYINKYVRSNFAEKIK